jgi:hypothetical protein
METNNEDFLKFIKSLKLGYDINITKIIESTIYTDAKKKILCYIVTGIIQNKEETIVVQMKDFINFKNGK